MIAHPSTSAKGLTAISMPRFFLQAEGLAILVAALAIYGQNAFSWGWLALFLLTPDVALLLYPINERVGSLVYNLLHTLIFPLALALFSLNAAHSLGLQVALIWLAHIGMDRAVGYGFKYAGRMKETHFGRV